MLSQTSLNLVFDLHEHQVSHLSTPFGSDTKNANESPELLEEADLVEQAP